MHTLSNIAHVKKEPDEESIKDSELVSKCFEREMFIVTPDILQNKLQPALEDITNAIKSESDVVDVVQSTKTKVFSFIFDSQYDTSLEISQIFKTDKDFLLKSNFSDLEFKNKSDSIACVDCKRVFENEDKLSAHSLLHTCVKVYKCFKCKLTLDSVIRAKEHRAKKHSVITYITCDFCGASFKGVSSLLRHKRRHNKEKLFKCETCLLCFNTKRSFTKHIRTHAKNKLYKCKDCGSEFTQDRSTPKFWCLISLGQQHSDISAAEISSDKQRRINDEVILFTPANIEEVTDGNFSDCPMCLNLANPTEEHLASSKVKISAHSTITKEVSIDNESSLTIRNTDKGIKLANNSQINNFKKSNKQLSGTSQAAQQKGEFLSDNSPAFVPKKTKSDGQQSSCNKAKPVYEWLCTYCEAYFKTKRSLTRHSLYHTLEKRFKCNECQAAFIQPGMLTAHRKKHTQLYKCTICDASLSSSSALTFHTNKHLNIKPYKCEICAESFSSSYSCSSHKIRVHGLMGRFLCSHCPKTFNMRNLLNIHERVHSGERPYTCEVCSATFTSQRSLHIHVKTHVSKCSFLCDVCGLMFTSSPSLFSHQAVHIKEKPFRCFVKNCQCTFDNRKSLQTHSVIHERARIYKCVDCATVLDSLPDATDHKKRRHVVKTYLKCKYCESSCSTLSSLTEHERVHTGERPYKCDVCTAEFASKRTLVNHSRIHSGDRPFQCEFCGRAFTQCGALTTHRRIHTGEMPYQCPHCPRRFNNSSAYVKHKREHCESNSPGKRKRVHNISNSPGKRKRVHDCSNSLWKQKRARKSSSLPEKHKRAHNNSNSLGKRKGMHDKSN